MSFVTVRRLALGAGLAFALCLGSGFAAAAPVAPEVKDKTGSADKIRQALDLPITLEMSDQTLAAALTKIREQTKVNFVVDKLLLQQMGLDPDQITVSAKLKDAKARTCLRSILSPYNLGYAIIGDTVVISTDDMVMQRQMQQRVTFDLEKADLAAALKQLSKDTATNLLLDTRVPAKDAKATVTLQLDDVPLETAVKLLAEAGGLKPIKVGNVMLVTTKNLANELRSDPELMQNAQQAQQEIQMMQQRRMQLMMQQQGGIGIFQPVNPPPPPPVDEVKPDPKDETPKDK